MLLHVSLPAQPGVDSEDPDALTLIRCLLDRLMMAYAEVVPAVMRIGV